MKQRIIGALVLGALGLIFLPLLFDFEPAQQLDTRSQIPPQPAIDEVEISAALSPDPLSTLDQPVETFAADEPSLTPQLSTGQPSTSGQDSSAASGTENQRSYGFDESGLPIAWVLQAGSFTESEKADQLRDRLLAKNFKAFIERATVDGTRYYRVYVGPKIDRDAAVAERTRLLEALGLEALVLSYKQQ